MLWSTLINRRSKRYWKAEGRCLSIVLCRYVPRLPLHWRMCTLMALCIGLLKTANIFVSLEGSEFVKVSDFGLARHCEESGHDKNNCSRYYCGHASIHESGAGVRSRVIRQHGHLQPGMHLYECLFGVPPFKTPGDYAVMELHANAEPLLPGKGERAADPVDVSEIIETAMEKNPGPKVCFHA